MTNVSVIIPFRDRGTDPYRSENLSSVVRYMESCGGWSINVVDDGRSGDEQFNRSAAYNRGLEVAGDSDVIIYLESDMLVPEAQLRAGVELARSSNQLVVPFTRYCYMSESDATLIRGGASPDSMEPESVMDGGTSIGAVNIVSRQALSQVGQWDEMFEGSWYDDNAMKHAFEVACGGVQWVSGDAYHLYHKPGWAGDHLTDEDRAATERNKLRWEMYSKVRDPEKIRTLTAGGSV